MAGASFGQRRRGRGLLARGRQFERRQRLHAVRLPPKPKKNKQKKQKTKAKRRRRRRRRRIHQSTSKAVKEKRGVVWGWGRG